LSQDHKVSSANKNLNTIGALNRTRSSLLSCSLLVAMVVWAPGQAEASLHRKSKRVDEVKKEQQPAPKGPLIISIAIANQHLTVYDGGVPIARAPVSTGMSGHPTPMGVFSVIQKQKWHQSNIYSGAPMPYMQRITWSGVAMHAGVLPGYPASHGCIRMPHDFAVRLYGMTKMGVRVFVTRNDVTPASFSDSHLFTPKPPEDTEPAPSGQASDHAKVDGRVASTDVIVAVATSNRSNDANGAPALVSNDTVKSDPPKAQSSPAAPVTPVNETAPVAEPKNDVAPATDPAKVDVLKTQGAPGSSNASPGEPIVDPKNSGAPVAAAQTQPESAATDLQTPGDATEVPLPNARPQLPPLKPGPITVFISRKLNKLFVRKGFESVFSSDITIENPERPLGTHVFTAADFTDDHSAMHWLLVSLPSEAARKEERRAETSHKHRDHNAAKAQSEPQPAETAAGALARIEIPTEARDRIAELITPGSSVIITDKDLGPETGESGETDFIVLIR
jgi:hypothetical protein